MMKGILLIPKLFKLVIQTGAAIAPLCAAYMYNQGQLQLWEFVLVGSLSIAAFILAADIFKKGEPRKRSEL